jgi:hypothetical protein
MFDDQVNRRDFMKRTAYVVPVILSLNAMPAFASAGSGNNGVGNGSDPQPPGNPPINDGPGTGPGNPGAPGTPPRHLPIEFRRRKKD